MFDFLGGEESAMVMMLQVSRRELKSFQHVQFKEWGCL